ncbi:MAG: hypothetical protein HOF33_01650 [Rhodospirillaceae bacterium]|nr:hypothetical protein [Rhodospirillaceae bacterium]MBT3925667.1 hypothetical protein [Rhodospirillaceae bacterium]MBT5780024.1 hypothetical protein [Rhodospirillaceae bacterium]MBT7291266.1 hypothetical protein [Rhodospirillaceae bacterium]
MICTNCQGENPDGHRFCGHCGAALGIICTACGFENAPGGKF